MKSGHSRSNRRCLSGRLTPPSFLILAAMMSMPSPVFAGEAASNVRIQDRTGAEPWPDEAEPAIQLHAERNSAFGLRRFQLDGGSRLVGWKLTDRWYLGRQRGEGSTLALVWQKDHTRFSLAPDGVRLTRSF